MNIININSLVLESTVTWCGLQICVYTLGIFLGEKVLSLKIGYVFFFTGHRWDADEIVAFFCDYFVSSSSLNTTAAQLVQTSRGLSLRHTSYTKKQFMASGISKCLLSFGCLSQPQLPYQLKKTIAVLWERHRSLCFKRFLRFHSTHTGPPVLRWVWTRCEYLS